MNYYTYAYLREDGTPYYVGKGKNKRAFRLHTTVNRPPEDRIIFLKKNLTEAEALDHERYMIAVLGRKDNNTGILRNRTDGGQGTSGRKFIMTDAHRAALSQAFLASEKQRKKNCKKYKVTYADGRQEVILGLREFMRGRYLNSNVYEMLNGRRKKHRDLVAIERLD